MIAESFLAICSLVSSPVSLVPVALDSLSSSASGRGSWWVRSWVSADIVVVVPVVLVLVVDSWEWRRGNEARLTVCGTVVPLLGKK